MFRRHHSHSRTTASTLLLSFAVSANANFQQQQQKRFFPSDDSGVDASSSRVQQQHNMTDQQYPGTALERMRNGRDRAASLSEKDLSGNWEDVRQKLLWAAGLKDLQNARPGKGYTGHCFNDFNHVDATTMQLEASDNENQGRVAGIAFNNPLGNGIRVARDESMGAGGSWCTCAMGGAQEPPADVAHVQFQSKIAWKLVWVPPTFERFVLVDDEGNLLATGVPSGGNIPALRERKANYDIVRGGRYAREADKLAGGGGVTR